MADEDKEDNERDDGDGEHNNATEQPSAGLATVNTISTWLSVIHWQFSIKSYL